MITQELKTAWVAALRSGDFAQAKSTLRVWDDDIGQARYCCLGVLCVVARRDPQGEKMRDYDWVDQSLGSETRKALVALNDHACALFPEIADWVEANVETSDG